MKKQLTAEEFDRMVDEGEDVSALVEPAANKTVNIDLPRWMIEDLDAAAGNLNISRKAMINVVLGQFLQAQKAFQASGERRRTAV